MPELAMVAFAYRRETERRGIVTWLMEEAAAPFAG
jgi:hypothetical protein